MFKYIFFLKKVAVSFFVDKKHFTRNNGMCRARKWMKWKYGEKIGKFCGAVRHILSLLCRYYYSVGSLCIAFQGNMNDLLCCTCTSVKRPVWRHKEKNSIQTLVIPYHQKKRKYMRLLLRFACS